jgi:hypothetical protein
LRQAKSREEVVALINYATSVWICYRFIGSKNSYLNILQVVNLFSRAYCFLDPRIVFILKYTKLIERKC